MRFLVIYSLVILISIYNVFGQSDNNANIKKVDELFLKYNSKVNPGAAVIIVKDGKIICEAEYGMSDLEHDIPITSSTVFHIGSVSKQFTGFSVLLLEELGKLKLNDKIRKYLPELPEIMDKITIRHLLNHTSGIREQENLFAICGITTADYFTNYNSMEIIKRQKELNFEPGDEVEYSNSNYILAAFIVEKITGKSFRDWTSENIFQPLGMVNTHFSDDNMRIIKNFASSYFEAPDKKELLKGILGSNNTGSTGIKTTTADMAKWLLNFSNLKIGSKKIIKHMFSDTGYTNKGELIDYNYGMAISRYKGLPVIFAPGSDAGYRAFDAYFPDYNFGVAVLSNFYSISARESGFKIAEIFLDDKMEKPAKTLKNESNSKGTPKEAQKLSKEDLLKYAGKYCSDELETQYSIILKDSVLILKHIRNEDIQLTCVDSDIFKGMAPMENVRFIRDKDNNITGFRVTYARARNILFNKK